MILFDPKESVDFQGNTASFIQYSYARIQSIIRGINFESRNQKYIRPLNQKEKEGQTCLFLGFEEIRYIVQKMMRQKFYLRT